MNELGIISILKTSMCPPVLLILAFMAKVLVFWHVCSLLDFAPCRLLQVGVLRCPPLLCAGRLKQVQTGLPWKSEPRVILLSRSFYRLHQSKRGQLGSSAWLEPSSLGQVMFPWMVLLGQMGLCVLPAPSAPIRTH